MDESIKNWIDNATLEQLLHKWRFGEHGDEYFQGEAGAYYSRIMFAKRDADPAAWVRASKSVGWRERLHE